MYNKFPAPDPRFIHQFINARGPEAVLERLENRASLVENQHSQGHTLDCKDVSVI